MKILGSFWSKGKRSLYYHDLQPVFPLRIREVNLISVRHFRWEKNSVLRFNALPYSGNMTRGVTRTTTLTSLYCTDHDHSSNITFLLECLDNESLLVTIRNTSLGWKCDRRALRVSTAAVPILFVGRRTSSVSGVCRRWGYRDPN